MRIHEEMQLLGSRGSKPEARPGYAWPPNPRGSVTGISSWPLMEPHGESLYCSTAEDGSTDAHGHHRGVVVWFARATEGRDGLFDLLQDAVGCGRTRRADRHEQ